MESFLSFKALDGVFLEAEKNLKKDNCAVSFIRTGDGAKHHVLSQIEGKKIIVVSDRLQARSLEAGLKGYGLKAEVLPEREDALIFRKTVSKNSMFSRVKALDAFSRGELDALIVSAEGALSRYPKSELFKKYSFELKPEDIIDPLEAAKKLSLLGYERFDAVSEPGEFALRGDILDVWVAGSSTPVRISFFDDMVESVTVYDIESGGGKGKLDFVRFLPSSDLLIEDKKNYEHLKEIKGSTGAHARLSELLPKLECGALGPGFIYLLPFFEKDTTDIFGFDKDCYIIFDEPKLIFEKLTVLEKEHTARVKTLLGDGEIFPAHQKALYSVSQIAAFIKNRKLVSLSSLELSNPLFSPSSLIDVSSRAVTKYCYDQAAFASDMKQFVLSDFTIVLSARDDAGVSAAIRNLKEAGVGYSETVKRGAVCVKKLGIEKGFIYPKAKFVLVGAEELSGKKHEGGTLTSKKPFAPPKEGDYVVHATHGIGVCKGTVILDAGGYKKEYVALSYLDGDLFVAIDQMDSLSKFVGEANPPLNKLGGKEFAREKEKVRKSVKKLAIDLMRLYAEREKIQGFKYSEDTVWQKEFEDMFEYEETPDQHAAINEIKREMEEGKVMDRLICGDVGFGKTEVAFRAMFKTVIDGKQAAMLAPTTILAKQHYETLLPRLKPFGIECALLTRLKSKGEAEEIASKLKEGKLPLVIGTHRMLSSSIEFKDLGLLVLDEEQRFGVEHKEKLKAKYPTINVITLSATPIPRTFNMSLSGIRDISLLETAPKGRLNTETYVIEYSDSLIVDAIERETARGGQTLVLYNKVESIQEFVYKLKSKLPSYISVIYAHGQMHPKELEQRMEEFYDKKHHVLVATTIIENGIDLPDANTLIVIDSMNFGLSSLYQLRGRVGRRGALAKAYFTVPKGYALSETAEKRLSALLENSEIGSGFKIALADLSIRGAGSILGAEQHGHIERVGYEMYIDILKSTIEELKTGISHESEDIDVKIDAAAYIPESYVSPRDKLRIYKRISEVSSVSERDNLIYEMENAYGPVESPVKNLINIALIRRLISGFNVKSVIITSKGSGINFRSNAVFENDRLLKAVADNRDMAVLTSTIPPSLIFNFGGLSPEEKLEKLVAFWTQARG